MPRITFQNNEHHSVDLHDPLVLGRSEKHANVVLRDERLSRAHCRIEPRDGDWAVVDLDSQNGTFLNGKRVRESMLRRGDVITIGAVEIRFETTGISAPSPVMPEERDATATLVAPAALVLIQGTLEDALHPVTHDPFNIGRKSDNHLCLRGDAKATGRHARIRREGLSYVIEDLGSTNGTLINGTRISGPVVLKPGSRVVVGSQMFKFQLQGRGDESSGESAPQLASAAAAPRAATSTDVSAAEEQDRTALKHTVVTKGTGGTLFAAIEILVVVAVAAAALYAAWTMSTGGAEVTRGEARGYGPARDGGLLATNPSFDERDEAGFPRGWRYLVSGTDSFTMSEGARGGRYGLQIQRFSTGNQLSLAISAPVEFEGAGVSASVFALNPGFERDRMGTAVLQVHWYAHPRDREPLHVSALAAQSRMREWTELSGSAARPAGARAFSLAVGLSGPPGSVMFDDAAAKADDGVEPFVASHEARAPHGMAWSLGGDGSLELTGPEGSLLRDGRVLLYAVDGRRDPLDPLQFLTAPPQIARQGDAIVAAWNYFDPLAAAAMKLNLRIGEREGAASLDAWVEGVGPGDHARASRFVGLNILATPLWMPSQVLRFAPEATTPASYTDTIADGRAVFGSLFSADTGSGNRIDATRADTRALVLPAGAGRELLLQTQQHLALLFQPGRSRDELQQQVALLSAVQPGETQVDRVQRAFRVMLEYPYNQLEIAAAAEAVDAASKHYRVRLIELRDAINVPQLTRNEQLYRAAMQEAITTAETLHTAAAQWQETGERLNALLGASGMNERSRQVAAKTGDALRQLQRVAHEFDELAENARRLLFLLEVEIEQRESAPHIASARDFLAASQYEQGMLKLRLVVQNYPRCMRGVEAKIRLAEVAGRLLDERDQFIAQGMNNIARDRETQAEELIELVRDNLLVRLLDSRQQQWLREMSESSELAPALWIERENELARTLLRLDERLGKA
jgi:pSer/pThr/pTyr-binding forkhead associated (FHA) protein